MLLEFNTSLRAHKIPALLPHNQFSGSSSPAATLKILFHTQLPCFYNAQIPYITPKISCPIPNISTKGASRVQTGSLIKMHRKKANQLEPRNFTDRCIPHNILWPQGGRATAHKSKKTFWSGSGGKFFNFPRQRSKNKLNPRVAFVQWTPSGPSEILSGQSAVASLWF